MLSWLAAFITVVKSENCSVTEIIHLYENALAYDEFQHGSLFIRAHLPTLLEYARRSRSIAELGVARGWSSVAFSRAALETASSGETYRYRMYDIIRAPGVQKVSPFLANCQLVDFHFLQQDVLNQSFLEQVGNEDGPFPPHDLLFIDTSHTREQLTQELEAFARYTTSYIILHDTETFGRKDEVVHDEGTDISYKRKLKLLEQQQVYHLNELMQEKQVASTKDLDLILVDQALQKAAEDLDHWSGLQNALRFWLSGSGSDWEILEHSLADNGLTVLGRKQQKSWEISENSTEICMLRLWQIRQLAPTLLDLSPRFPRDLAEAVRMDRRKAKEMEQHLRSARRSCPRNWEVKAAIQLLQWHMGKQPRLADGIHQFLEAAKEQSADLYFATLAQYQDLLDAQWIHLLEEGLNRWPNRLEAWLPLAQAWPWPVHAWRRCLVLCGKNRWVAAEALKNLQALGFGTEAATVHQRLSGVLTDGHGQKIFDPTERPSPVKVENIASASWNKDFQVAQKLLENHMPKLHTELDEFGGSEHKLLEFSACHFISKCDLVPLLCRTLEEIEAHGLQVLASAVVGANWKLEVTPNQFPGRIQLWCSFRNVEVLWNETNPERIGADSCFWFDESSSTLQIKSSEMRFVVFTFLHPAWNQHFELEISGEPVKDVLWLQGLLMQLGDNFRTASGSRFLEPQEAARFSGNWRSPWIHFASSLPKSLQLELCKEQTELSSALDLQNFEVARNLLALT